MLRLLPVSADWQIAHVGWSPPAATVVVELELLELLELLESADCSGLSMLRLSMLAVAVSKRAGLSTKLGELRVDTRLSGSTFLVESRRS
mmetsp:Transcript_7749/g.15815  ORF Transcript_7749/g.15815 Transcript_7749/m.15815 type:complete len:90 (+) Transcript_7749:244-513(+)